MAPQPKIRPAQPKDRKALRTLLPNLTGREPWSRIYVAEVEGQVASAAALVRTPAGDYQLQVAQKGTGTDNPAISETNRTLVLPVPATQTLWQSLKTEAHRHGIKTILAPNSVSIDSPEAIFWQALGFGRGRELIEWRVPFTEMAKQSAAQVAKLRARGKIPPIAQIVDLAEGDRQAIADLVATHIGGTPGGLLAELNNPANNSFVPELCLAVQLEGQSIGTKLARWYDEPAKEVYQEFTVIDPDKRGSWAWPLLHDEWARRCLNLGATHYRCSVDVDNQNMQSLTKRYGGKILDQVFRPVYSFAEASPESITAPGIRVRNAAGWERNRVRELIRSIDSASPPPTPTATQWVALHETSITGAAALSRNREHNLLYVEAVDSDPIVAQALFEQVLHECRQAPLAVVSSGERIEANTTAADAWANAGFTPFDPFVDFETDCAQLAAHLTKRVDHHRAEGRLPSNARILPLGEAEPRAVVAMHVEYLGGDPESLLRMIDKARPINKAGSGARFDPQLSTVLLVDNQLVGIRLLRISRRREAFVDALVVAPHLHRGWAGPYFAHDSMRRLLAAGHRKSFSRVDPANEKGMQTTLRHGGTELRRTFRARLHLAGPTQTAIQPSKGPITIVCGPPDETAAALMSRLERDGTPPLTDSSGSYAYQPAANLRNDASWLPLAVNRAVIVPSLLVTTLPERYSYQLKVQTNDPYRQMIEQFARSQSADLAVIS